jgi:hypothetical protein
MERKLEHNIKSEKKNELNIDRYGSLKEQPNANVPRERDDKMVDKQHTTTSRTIYVIKKA